VDSTGVQNGDRNAPTGISDKIPKKLPAEPGQVGAGGIDAKRK
jgi:hypothetical protein